MSIAPALPLTRASLLAEELEQVRGDLPGRAEEMALSTTRAQETRSAIMVAARAAFLENGIAATRLAAIARAAWFAPSTVSLHFKGKEALFAACLDEDIERLFAGARASTLSHPYPMLSGDFLRSLAAQLRALPLLATVLAHSPATWGVRFYESRELAEVIDELSRECSRAQEAGIVRTDLDVASMGTALGGVMAGTLWSVHLPSGPTRSLTEQFLVLLEASLLVPQTGAAALAEAVAGWRREHPWLAVRGQHSGVRPALAMRVSRPAHGMRGSHSTTTMKGSHPVAAKRASRPRPAV